LAMFLLASVDIGYTMWLLFGKLLKGDLSYQSVRLKYWFYVSNNVFADTLILYRCYVVWNYNKRVLIGPAILLVAATVCGYIMEGSSSATLLAHSWVYLLMTTILNAILTALTASRIWYVSRKASMSVDPTLMYKYHVTLSILIESGFIYCLYMIVDLSFNTNPSGSIVLDAGLIQVVGIMPTLILAQVGLGRTTQDDVEANIRTTHITDTKLNTSGNPSNASLRWKVANGLPGPLSSDGHFVTREHDQHHYLHFTNHQVPRSGLEPEAVELADNQQFEVDIVRESSHRQTPNRSVPLT